MIISKQGKFYIGDPCYVLSDEDYHEVWGTYNNFSDGTIDVDDDNAFIVNGTAWGDGQYTDQYGNIYSVDSGTLAIVPIELVSKTDGVKNGKVFEGSKADLDYYDDGVFVFSIDDKNYIIETGDQVTQQEEEEELDERFLGASDAVYKDSIEKGLYSETKDLQEDVEELPKHENFKGVEFEQDIPHRMRFKQYDFVNDNKDLYWITQQVFSEKELLVFLEAFKHTDFDKAYVTVRDFSTYDYNKDIDRNVLVVLDKNGIVDSTGYFDKIKDLGWQDLINESKNLHEKLNSYEKMTFAKHLLNAETDKDLKKIIDEIRPYSEPTYTKCMSILAGDGSTQYKAGQMSDMLYQLNESCNITERVLTSSNGKFKKGDVYINGHGAMIRITDYTKAGTPQYDIGMPADFTRGTYECRGTNSDESLQSILDNNGYVKVNESKQIKTEDIDYTYINKNPELQEAMEKIYEDVENKLDTELGIKLEGEGFGRFNPLYKKAEIKVNDDSYITIRLNYSLPDGIFNYITVYYSVELTTKEGAGQIGDLKYTDSTSTREIAHGSYTAFNEDTPDVIKQTSDTVEDCIKTVKDVLNGKIISKKESKQLKTERKKRVASYGEFDNGHVFHSWYDWTSEEAEEKAKQASINNPEDVFYVAVDDIMNPSTGIVYSNGQPYSTEEVTVKYIDGIPTVISNLDIKEETLNDDEKWKDENPQKYEYMLLDRLRLDCEYYLGNGNRQDKFLWAGNVDGQIAKMKELWYQLNEKPEWLTMEQIEDYAKKMGANELPSTVDNTAEEEINNMLDRSYDKETKVGLEESNYKYEELMTWVQNLQDYEPSEAWKVVVKETNNEELADDVAETIRVMKQQIGTLFEDVEYITKEELDAMPDEYKTTVGKTIRARQFAGDKVDDLKALYTKLGYTEDDPMILTLDSKQGTILKPVKVQEDKVLKTEDEKLGWQDLTQNDIQLYMNTWTNYEENGDNVESINGGWMNIDEAEDFYKQNGENHPIITGIQCEKDLPIIFEEAGNNLENINTLDLIEDIRTFTNSENQEALEAILETEQCTLDEAVERLNDTYFSYYPGVKNSGQLAQAIIREVGGYKNLFANANDILPYFKADELSEILVDKAVDAIFEKYPDIDNMDEIDDDMLEEELDNQVNDYLQRAFNEDNEEAIDAYFDYKAYGDSLEDNYTYTKYGAISI